VNSAFTYSSKNCLSLQSSEKVLDHTYWITEAGIRSERLKSSSQRMRAFIMSFWRGCIWYFSARMKSRARRPGGVFNELVMLTGLC